MAVGAVVKDGQLVESVSENSVKKAASKSGMDKRISAALSGPDEVSGPPGTHLKYRVYFTVRDIFTGRADAEYGGYHGTFKSIRFGWKDG